MRALAALPNVVCKVSGVVTETRGADWTLDGVRPFVAHALDSFGYDRCLFASDWFVCTRCTTLPRWVAALDALLDERRATDAQRAAFFSDNATRVYRLRAQ
jgi:L-fuconolactonase